MSRFSHLLRATAAAAVTAAGVGPADAQTPFPASAAVVAPAPMPISVRPEEAPPATDVNDLFRAGLRRAPTPGNCEPNPCNPAVPGAVNPANPYLPPATTAPGTGAASAPSVPNLFAGADAGPTAGQGGYIDNAVPVTMARIRYESAYGNNRPDRAEFFYAKCGCFKTPNANGPPRPETNIDYQEIYSYLEYAVNPRFSAFANVPVRFINPEQNVNAYGWGDLNFGAKYAVLYGPTRVLSVQLQVIVPTGRERLGLGTGVTWLEPGLLYQEQLSDRWQVFAQLKDQIPLMRQSDFTGNVLTYGVGTSYVVARGCWGYVAPVGEVVGWTVLSGKETDPILGAVSARGDTIVNGKLGVRIGFGKVESGQPYPTRSDLYIGYGRALTGEVWYRDMVRAEYRLFF